MITDVDEEDSATALGALPPALQLEVAESEAEPLRLLQNPHHQYL